MFSLKTHIAEVEEGYDMHNIKLRQENQVRLTE